MKTRTPGLIRTRHVNACARQLETDGTVTHLLDSAGLPAECLLDENGVLPTSYLAEFLSSACAAGEISSCSHRAAPATLASYPGLDLQITASSSLLDAFETFRLGATELSRLHFRISEWDSKTWIYATPASVCLEEVGWSSYLLRPMIEVARAAAGSDWWPRTVNLPSTHSAQPNAFDFPSEVNVDLHAEVLAVEIPREILFLPLHSRSALRRDRTDLDYQEIPTELVPGLRLLLQTFMGKRPLKLTELADLAGCSPRSLQRDLRSADCCFSTLFQEARYLSSVPLLTRGSASITDVAYELGYSDPAHFSRAFQRMSGTSPSEFRRVTATLA